VARVIVLDASVMIAVLDGSDPHFPRAKVLLAAHVSEQMLAHRLTLSESLVAAVRAGRGEEASAALRAVGIEPIDVLDDPLELAQVRAETGLKMPDGCVLLAARRAGATLATFDVRLADAARAGGVPVAS
jgi:predicted nucleic acid-binding protein